MNEHPRTQENRVRRAAVRQGYVLKGSGRRDKRARNYGRFYLHDDTTGELTYGGRWGMTLDELEAILNGEHDAR